MAPSVAIPARAIRTVRKRQRADNTATTGGQGAKVSGYPNRREKATLPKRKHAKSTTDVTARCVTTTRARKLE
jgi:hypothetical protein